MSKPDQYLNKSKEDLVEEINKLKKEKTYGLVWEKNKTEENLVSTIIEKHPVLVEETKNRIKNNEDFHFFIEGENLFALNSLYTFMKEKIDFIYIDPPFNTGHDFIYNDKLVDSEDGYKHSKWLSFMNNRLRIAKYLLKETGSILVHIDDNESAHLKLLMDEIFGEKNFRNSIIWSYRTGGAPSKNDVFAKKHDTIYFYSKNPDKFYFEKLKQKIIYEKAFFGDMPKDEDGNYYAEVYLRDSIEGEINLMKNSKKYKDINVKPVINVSKERVEGFPTQKPKGLMKYFIEILVPEKGIVLDFFAGSGSTAHSVLEINSEENKNIKSISVTNNENNIANEKTYPRFKKLFNEFGSSLKYYTIDFVSADRTDPSLYELATNLVDTICLKENTFEKIKKTQDVHIYNNKEDHYSVIVFNEDKLNTALKELEKTDGSYTFYIFSLGGNTFDEELEEFKKEHPKTVSVPFPQEIKKLYSSLKL